MKPKNERPTAWRDLDDEDLARTALATLENASVPDGLAERAYHHAMSHPPPQLWPDLLREIFRLGRLVAPVAAAAALITVLFAGARDAQVAVVASLDDAWVASVLPFDPRSFK